MSTAPATEARLTLSRLEQDVFPTDHELGRARMLEAALNAWGAAADADGDAADAIIFRWVDIGGPASLIPDETLAGLFGKASHWARMLTLTQLAHNGADVILERLLDILPAEARERTSLLAMAVRDVRRLDFASARSRFAELLAGANDAEVYLSRNPVRDLRDPALGLATAMHPRSHWNVDAGGGMEIVADRSSVANTGYMRAVFGAAGDAPFAGDRLTFDAFLAYLRLAVEGGGGAELLSRACDYYYMLHDPNERLGLAAVVAGAVRAGFPVTLTSLAHAVDMMALTSRQAHVPELIARANIIPPQHFGGHAFFQIRRACAMTPDAEEARRLAGRIAGVLTAGPHLDHVRSYFEQAAQGRRPAALQPREQHSAAAFIHAMKPEIMDGPRAPARQPGRPRVALVIAGQLRAYRNTAARIRAQIAEPLGADVFVSTWDNTGFAAGYHNDLQRVLPHEVWSRLPGQLRTYEAFANRFPEAVTAMAASAAKSREVIDATGGGRLCAIMDEADFEARARQHFRPGVVSERWLMNQLKMFAGFRMAARLVEQAEDEDGAPYDVIVRIRPDMDISAFVHTDVLAPLAGDDIVHVNLFHPHGVSDQFAFGSRNAMGRYLNVFDYLHAARGFDGLEYGQGLSGEAFIHDCLSFQGIRFVETGTIRYQLSSVLLPAPAIARLMLHRLDAGDPMAAWAGQLAGG